MKTLTKLSLVLALLFMTTATFAAPKNSRVLHRSTKETILIKENPTATTPALASQNQELQFKQAVVPYTIATATMVECCKVTCYVEVNLLVITIGTSWCCVACDPPKKNEE